MVDFAEIIRNAGLKATRSRLSVLNALAEIGGHCSADQVYQHLNQKGEGVPRGTVFKVVGDLSESGVLMVTDVGPGRTLYEYAEVWHHHFVCRKCSRILDVPCVEGRKPCLLPDVEVPAIIEEAQIIFRGVCHECAKP
jgi:Fe2+ or Zn2+ uptake regulation protein